MEEISFSHLSCLEEVQYQHITWLVVVNIDPTLPRFCTVLATSVAVGFRSYQNIDQTS